MGQDLTFGERVAWYRHRRGMPQEALAGLVGRTADWLSKVENGRANLERLSIIKALADALDVTVGDLLGEPAVMDWTTERSQRTVSRLREALMDYPALTTSLSEPAPVLEDVSAGIDDIWEAYQASRFVYVTTRLPQVIASARHQSQTATTEVERRDALGMLALAYHAAAATLTKVGEADLSWIASDRGVNAAEASQDPAVLASLLRSVAHAMLANGHYAAAADVATRASERLRAQALANAPLHWSLLGSLQLVGAMASARADAAPEAREFLAEARLAAEQLGQDANHGWTAFGPTNVAVHDLSIAVELGDIQAAAAIAPTVDVRALPVERRVRHALEVAKVFSMTNRRDDALAVVLQAEQEAPEQVRYHYLARELVLSWMRQRRSPSRDLVALAQRLHVA